MSKAKTVRAVDVGYGNTKFTVGMLDQEFEAICDMFPSLTPTALQNDFSRAIGQQRDTHKIEIRGETYECGKEVRLALGGGSHDRVLDENFCLSNRYLALVRAALAYMGVDEIDCLVLGLPLTTYEAKRRSLEQAVAGAHEIGNKTIKVHKVTVVPQPMGGFYDYVVQNNMTDAIDHEMNLIIDPGYYTLDWVVSQGSRPIDSRSAAVNEQGASTILTAVRDAIEADLSCDPGDIMRIDESLRTGRVLRVHGKHVDLEKYRPLIRQIADSAVNKLITGTRGIVDIENVILVGGATHLYHDAVKARFPNLEVHTGGNPVYANVRGFQMLGEQWLRSNESR